MRDDAGLDLVLLAQLLQHPSVLDDLAAPESQQLGGPRRASGVDFAAERAARTWVSQ